MKSIAWQDRLFMIEAAVLLLAIGAAWIKGWPKYRSIWGLQFSIALQSEEKWRAFHRRAGWLGVTQALWLLIPFQSAAMTGLIQIPAALFGTIIAIVVIKRDLEK